MNEAKVLVEMRSALSLSTQAEGLTTCVVTLRQRGISKQRLYELLTTLRKEFADGRDEPREDAVLETMDYVWHEMK